MAARFLLPGGAFTGDATNPPTILGGASVTITDSAGVERLAPLHSVSAHQINYVVPRGTANGRAKVTISTARGIVSISPLDVAAVEPAVFCGANWLCGWTPVSMAYVVRIRDGVQTTEPLRDVSPDELDEYPFQVVDLGPETDQVYLILLGMGLRNRSSLAGVSVKFGDLEAPVAYAGPQGEYAGLDQVNVRLSRSLAGRSGPRLTVDGKSANEAWLTLR